MLTKLELKWSKTVKAPLWSLSSNPNQKGQISKVRRVEDSTNSEIEKIVATPSIFESYFWINYQSCVPKPLSAILSQWEHEFIKNINFLNPWDGTNRRSEKRWRKIINDISKFSIVDSPFLHSVVPHMIENFAEIEGDPKEFSKLIELWKSAKSSGLVQRYDERMDEWKKAAA